MRGLPEEVGDGEMRKRIQRQGIMSLLIFNLYVIEEAKNKLKENRL